MYAIRSYYGQHTTPVNKDDIPMSRKIASAKTTLDPLMTIQEVADFFGVAYNTVWRWARSGKLTRIQPALGTVRFRRAEVEALGDASKQAT